MRSSKCYLNFCKSFVDLWLNLHRGFRQARDSSAFCPLLGILADKHHSGFCWTSKAPCCGAVKNLTEALIHFL